MDAVILCGGFAKRMWPLTRDTPKALLEVRGRPVLEHILDRLDGTGMERVFISTNKRFEGQFRGWLRGYKGREEIRIVVELSLSEGEKLGSIGAWGFLIRKEGLNGDLVSISGDNFFDFGLRPFLDFFREKEGVVVGVFPVSKEDASRFGIVELDKGNRITGFEEKPERPRGALASTGIYVFPGEVLKMVLEYLNGGRSPDKAGLFLKWLYKIRPVYGFRFSGKWVDIGSLEAYNKLNQG
jgi:glucose-1-phosphate thymidylyltransferase